MTYLSHLTFIESVATQTPQKICFKCPQLDIEDEIPHRKIIGWKEITYERFYHDIKQCAKYWTKELDCPPGSIVGIWMFGLMYKEHVNFFGLKMAGFVPQILNLKIQSPEAALVLFKESDINHIIHAPAAPAESLRDHFKVHEMLSLEHLSSLGTSLQNGHTKFESSPLKPKEESEWDVTDIYHTSGSTAGRPKLIRHLRRWVDGNAKKTIPGLTEGTDIAIAMNGMVHVSQFLVSLQQFKSGACVVLMPWIDLTSSELMQIITECKANNLYQLTPILNLTLREAMTNSQLEMQLKPLDCIVHGGAAIADVERTWATERGIRLRNIYGSTEMGINMASNEDPLVLHPFQFPGCVYEFRNMPGSDQDESTKLVQMIIMPSSLDCPPPSLCDPKDGCYYSGDLFQKAEPSGYIYRGRLVDRIIMNNGAKCDTLYIEGEVLMSCKELVSGCVVVGSGRRSPSLIVEPFENQLNNPSLKNEIGQKVQLINKDGFPHERIHPSRIIIVPMGTLPRSPKGNVNRSLTEEMFKKEIDALYKEESVSLNGKEPGVHRVRDEVNIASVELQVPS